MGITEHTRSALSRFDCEWKQGWPELRSGAARDLVEHWRALFVASDGQIPLKSDIDAVDIRTTLSRVYIYERDGEDFIRRLAGEQISWTYDSRLKDRRLSEILDAPIHGMVRLFMRVCLEEPAIYRNHGLLYSDERKRRVVGERVFLPLRGDDGETTHIMGVTDVTGMDDAPNVATRSFHPCAALSRSTERVKE